MKKYENDMYISDDGKFISSIKERVANYDKFVKNRLTKEETKEKRTEEIKNKMKELIVLLQEYTKEYKEAFALYDEESGYLLTKRYDPLGFFRGRW